MRTKSIYYCENEEFEDFINDNYFKDEENLLVQVFSSELEKTKLRQVIDTIVKFLPQAKIIGATTDGEDISNIDFANKRALIMGNEHSGLSNKILNKLDTKITIKMKNDFDSLNVSSAAAILIHSMKL